MKDNGNHDNEDDDNKDGKVGGKQLYDNLGGVTIDLSEMLIPALEYKSVFGV